RSDRAGLARRLRFLGLRHDVPAILAGADVLALTSLWEGLPNVVIEAMATGAVAVATDVGGCSELITSGETGFLLPTGDPDAVAGGGLNGLGSHEAQAALGSARVRAADGRSGGGGGSGTERARLPRGRGASGDRRAGSHRERVHRRRH